MDAMATIEALTVSAPGVAFWFHGGVWVVDPRTGSTFSNRSLAAAASKALEHVTGHPACCRPCRCNRCPNCGGCR